MLIIFILLVLIVFLVWYKIDVTKDTINVLEEENTRLVRQTLQYCNRVQELEEELSMYKRTVTKTVLNKTYGVNSEDNSHK